MTFLNPAILFGLLASSIPILIHLLNLRKLQKVEFSTLAFLKELQKTKVKKIKMKQWLLLLLRVLIILFLVMSFARPALDQVSVGAGSTAKSSAVIIVDNSFSMSVVNENGSFLNQAKVAAKKIVNEFIEGDEVTILTTAPNEDKVFSSTNQSALLKKIDEIQTNFYSINLLDQINFAFESLSTSNNFNKEIYIISDFQEEFFSEANEIKYEQLKDLKMYLLPLNRADVRNLSLTEFKSDNQIFELNKSIVFTANVRNNSSNTLSNNVLSLFINGKRTAQQSFDIESGESKKIVFEHTLLSTGFLDIFVELEEDDIEFDNRRYTTLFVPEEMKILSVADNQTDLSYLNIALEGTNDSYFNVEKANTTRFNSFNFSEYDIFIISGNGYSSNLNKLKAYIEAGGSVILLPGSTELSADISNITRGLGIPSAESFIKSDDSFFTFDKVDYDHPIFKDLFESNKKQIESPEVYKYLKTFNRGKGKTLISLVDGSAFLSEYSVGKGKVLVFSSLPILSWSNFPVKGIFAPLINKMVSYLSLTNSSINQYIVGDQINVNGSSLVEPAVRVLKPDNTEEFIQPELRGFNKQFSYSDSDLNGIYKFYNGSKLFETVAVNLYVRESSNKYLEAGDVEELLSSANPELNIINLTADDNFAEEISQARFGTELWKLFLIIALILALIEMTVSKSSKKDIAEINS